MSSATKLSPALKSVISRRHDPLPGPARQQLFQLFDSFSAETKQHRVGEPAWIVPAVRPIPISNYPLRFLISNLNVLPCIYLQTGALFTLNSPSSLLHLSSYLQQDTSPTSNSRLSRFALVRESGLKCTSFIGIPRVCFISAFLARERATDSRNYNR
jgi:hypothetical protein